MRAVKDSPATPWVRRCEMVQRRKQKALALAKGVFRRAQGGRVKIVRAGGAAPFLLQLWVKVEE